MGQRVVSQGVSSVSGMRGDGFRELLAVEVADTESEATYQELFRSLKARGLKGVELVPPMIIRALEAAIARHFRGASWQCWQLHYTRNLTELVPRALSARSLRRARAECSPPPPGR